MIYKAPMSIKNQGAFPMHLFGRILRREKQKKNHVRGKATCNSSKLEEHLVGPYNFRFSSSPLRPGVI